MKMKMTFVVLLVFSVVIALIGCGSGERSTEASTITTTSGTEATTATTTASETTTMLETSEEGRKGEIELAVLNRINDGDYTFAELDEITINNNYGSDDPDNNFILLVYFIYSTKNTKSTGNDLMRMYSDDLVATLAKQGFDDINEAAIFWEDDYNDRSVKYAYEYRNKGFYITDIAGE